MAEPAEKKTRRASVNEALQGSKERLQQEWKARFKAEQEAREKAESTWERRSEAKVAWEEARRAHEVARDTLHREERLADIAREQSYISRAFRVREETDQEAIQRAQVRQEWKARFKAELEAREKAESAWERSYREKRLTDIAREQSCISRAREQAASAGRRTKEEIRELEGPPVIPDDDSDSSRVTLSLDQFGDSQTPFEDSQIPE